MTSSEIHDANCFPPDKPTTPNTLNTKPNTTRKGKLHVTPDTFFAPVQLAFSSCSFFTVSFPELLPWPIPTHEYEFAGENEISYSSRAFFVSLGVTPCNYERNTKETTCVYPPRHVGKCSERGRVEGESRRRSFFSY